MEPLRLQQRKRILSLSNHPAVYQNILPVSPVNLLFSVILKTLYCFLQQSGCLTCSSFHRGAGGKQRDCKYLYVFSSISSFLFLLHPQIWPHPDLSSPVVAVVRLVSSPFLSFCPFCFVYMCVFFVLVCLLVGSGQIETPMLNLAKRVNHWVWDPNEERKRLESWQQEQERLLQVLQREIVSLERNDVLDGSVKTHIGLLVGLFSRVQWL